MRVELSKHEIVLIRSALLRRCAEIKKNEAMQEQYREMIALLGRLFDHTLKDEV